MVLAEIRDSKLYRVHFSTFDAYCQEKWGFKKVYASYLITSAETVVGLPEKSFTMVNNEKQARALSSVPEPDREKVLEAASEKAKSLLPHLPGQPLLPHITTGLENLLPVLAFQIARCHDHRFDSHDCPVQTGSDVGQGDQLSTLGSIPQRHRIRGLLGQPQFLRVVVTRRLLLGEGAVVGHQSGECLVVWILGPGAPLDPGIGHDAIDSAGGQRGDNSQFGCFNHK